MGDRIIYDSGLRRDARVSSIIRNGSWAWPVANSPDLIVLKNSIPNQMTPHQECGDRVIWTLHPGGWFSVSSAWRAFNAHRPPVPWHPLVWFGDSLPRASFILWLAIRGRLGTHDRLFNLSPDACCLLCGNFQEDHNHLFFGCAVSK